MAYTSNAYWTVDMFEPSHVGGRYTRTVRFFAPSGDREAALAAMSRRRMWRGNETHACNLTPPRQPHVAWPERPADWDRQQYAAVAYRPE